MATKQLKDLTEATSAAGDDLFHLQNPTGFDRKVTKAVLFAEMNERVLTDVPLGAVFTDTQRAITSTPNNGDVETTLTADWGFDVNAALNTHSSDIGQLEFNDGVHASLIKSSDRSQWQTLLYVNGTDIQIKTGQIPDSTFALSLKSLSNIGKRLNLSWAEGNWTGGLFAGTSQGFKTYHVFVIRKDSNGNIDFGFDTSVIAANRPAGWSLYRRIASVFTDGSGDIVPFFQRGDYFGLEEMHREVSATPQTNVTNEVFTHVPSGVPNGITADIYATNDTFNSEGQYARVSSEFYPDSAVTATNSNLKSEAGNMGVIPSVTLQLPVGVIPSVNYKADHTAISNLEVYSNGWWDTRDA